MFSEKSCQFNPKKQSHLTFPWWCLFIAYGLSLIFAGISIFFIIARGIEFGDLKTQKWLTSLLSGFFSSILLIQPIKVILFMTKTFDKNVCLYCRLYLWQSFLLGSFEIRIKIKKLLNF
jgi:hypothetical protein